jgi:hypothetical protein
MRFFSFSLLPLGKTVTVGAMKWKLAGHLKE